MDPGRQASCPESRILISGTGKAFGALRPPSLPLLGPHRALLSLRLGGREEEPRGEGGGSPPSPGPRRAPGHPRLRPGGAGPSRAGAHASAQTHTDTSTPGLAAQPSPWAETHPPAVILG